MSAEQDPAVMPPKPEGSPQPELAIKETPPPTIELAVPALEGDDDIDLPETDEEAYQHVPQPGEQFLKNGMPVGEEVEIVSDNETHHYAVARWRGQEFRERIPLHVFKMAPGKQLQELNVIAQRLRARLCKKIAGGPPDMRSEKERRRRGRKLAKREAEEMLRERVQSLHTKMKAASHWEVVFTSPETFYRAQGFREATAHMLGRDPEPIPKPSKFLCDGATLADIAAELGLQMAEKEDAARAAEAAAPAGDAPASSPAETQPVETTAKAPTEDAKPPKPRGKGAAKKKAKAKAKAKAKKRKKR